MPTPPLPEVVSEQEWQVARDRLLTKEKQATHALDALAAERRRLPMVRFRSDYSFETPTGQLTLLELFEGRRQLVVYQFMDVGPDGFCPGCTNYTSTTDLPAARAALREQDTSYVTVSDMPLAQILARTTEKGWTVPFYSSRGTTFSQDTGAGGGFLLSAFLRDGLDVFRTYSTRGRGVDRLMFDVNIADLTALGRQEDWEEPRDASPASEAHFSISRAASQPTSVAR